MVKRIKHPLHSQGIHSAGGHLGPPLPLAHPSFPPTHLFQVLEGKCHGAGSLCHAGEEHGVQFPLSISSVSPTWPQAVPMPVQTALCIAASCHCICMGRICPGPAISDSDQAEQPALGGFRCCQRFSEQLLLCHAQRGARGSSPGAGREGQVPAGLEGAVQAQGGSTGLHSHRHVGNPNTSTLTIHCTLLPSVLPWQTLPCVLWGSWRFDREGLASALP